MIDANKQKSAKKHQAQTRRRPIPTEEGDPVSELEERISEGSGKETEIEKKWEKSLSTDRQK